MSCNLQNIRANIYSKLPVAPFCAKSMVLGGWMGGGAGLRIAYSNQKLPFLMSTTLVVVPNIPFTLVQLIQAKNAIVKMADIKVLKLKSSF